MRWIPSPSNGSHTQMVFIASIEASNGSHTQFFSFHFLLERPWSRPNSSGWCSSWVPTLCNRTWTRAFLPSLDKNLANPHPFDWGSWLLFRVSTRYKHVFIGCRIHPSHQWQIASALKHNHDLNCLNRQSASKFVLLHQTKEIHYR